MAEFRLAVDPSADPLYLSLAEVERKWGRRVEVGECLEIPMYPVVKDFNSSIEPSKAHNRKAYFQLTKHPSGGYYFKRSE